jgi:DHA1 family bicyclomycin/chloramphenicol resistance-like MFS transporter
LRDSPAGARPGHPGSRVDPEERVAAFAAEGPAQEAAAARQRPGFREFVVMIASLMALTALAIDSMLPALPAIGHALAVVHDNERQLVVTFFLLGLGLGQIVCGTLSDRFGRKPVLLGGLVLYVLFSALAALSVSFEMLLVMRLLEGLGASAARVVTVSVVRDRYAGRRMARVMSLAMIIFLAIPILAPAIGQLILSVAPWRWIFGVLAVFGTAVLAFTMIRLPETLHPEYRRSLRLRDVGSAWRTVLTNRTSICYTAALTFMTGALFGAISSMQQIFYDVFREPSLFPLMFALPAGTMGIASLTNAHLVERIGTRRISHAGLLGFIFFGVVHTGVVLAGYEQMWTFVAVQALAMASFALSTSNFSSMAMEPVGHIAGTASSVQGTLSTIGGAILGSWIGQQFDGTVLPFAVGTTLCGVAALVAVLVAEKGRLFRPHDAPPARPAA